jgi:NAD(P)-dependent dehydrogenase (short-subunit alcohol dehydrogenase family)
MNFEGRSVMITGAAGNLGQALAAAFAERGAQLALVDRSPQALGTAFAARHGACLVTADLLEREQARSAVDAALQRFGRLDALCHLVGGFRMGEAVHETSDSTWDFLFDVNARTLVNIAHAVVPHMVAHGGGKIVTVGAYAARSGLPAMGAYCAAKSSVVRLTEAMSAELKEKHINVNCVLPGIIDTPENRASMPDADPRRWVPPHALADVILFLASDEARAIHGAAVPVTGLS